MIDEMERKGRIDKKRRQKLLGENFRQRWFGLANAVGVPLDRYNDPHKAIWNIFEIRDDLFHVNYDELNEKLSKLGHYDYFTRFVNAMDDYNVQLRKEASNPEVLMIGKFE